MLLYGVVDDSLDEAVELFLDRREAERVVADGEPHFAPSSLGCSGGSTTEAHRKVSGLAGSSMIRRDG